MPDGPCRVVAQCLPTGGTHRIAPFDDSFETLKPHANEVTAVLTHARAGLGLLPLLARITRDRRETPSTRSL